MATVFRYDFTLATAASLCCNPNTQFTNHESLPSLHESFAYFIKAYPQFSQTDQADYIRHHDYRHLKHVCLDYIGHGLFSFSQLHNNYQTPSLPSTSSSPPPQLLNAAIEPLCFDVVYKSVNLHTQFLYGGQESEFEFEMKKRILAYMNMSELDYTLILTANQSSAFKLVADAYPFHNNPNLLSVYDYKNEAVDLMNESCKKRRGRATSAEFNWPNMRVHASKLKRSIGTKKKTMRKRQPGLFVFPLQSRVTGVRYSYQWMNIAQENGWHVLLDACALGPKDMETLGLSLFKPDFLICSFFKVFGENPSGFGCLFVKKSSASLLKDSSAASSIGIVSLIASCSTPYQTLVQKSCDKLASPNQMEVHEMEYSDQSIYEESENWESYESGKRSSGIECRGLDHADELGLVVISRRSRYLINWLVNALLSLQHPHYSEYGHQLVKIYGPKIKFDRGPSLAFNIFDWKGEKIEPSIVQKLADRHSISLSYGILDHVWFSEKETKSETCRSEVEGGQVSLVTVALGFLTNFEDVYRVWVFVSRFLDADFVEKERWRYMALNQKTVEFALEKLCEIMKIMEHRNGGKDFVTNKDISLLLPGTFYLTEVDSKYRRFYAQKDGAENGSVTKLTITNGL